MHIVKFVVKPPSAQGGCGKSGNLSSMRQLGSLFRRQEKNDNFNLTQWIFYRSLFSDNERFWKTFQDKE